MLGLPRRNPPPQPPSTTPLQSKDYTVPADYTKYLDANGLQVRGGVGGSGGGGSSFPSFQELPLSGGVRACKSMQGEVSNVGQALLRTVLACRCLQRVSAPVGNGTERDNQRIPMRSVFVVHIPRPLPFRLGPSAPLLPSLPTHPRPQPTTACVWRGML